MQKIYNKMNTDAIKINKIEVRNISKKFKVKIKGKDVALSHLTHFFQDNNKKTFIQVLDDVSFDVKEGEILGIIGRNGSGKTTLLQIMADLFKQNSGKIKREGEVFYLTSMGVGIMEKLSMRENIFLVGALMGVGKKEMKEIYKEIVDFSELGDFVDMKVSQFSKGMVGRLGFSISVFCLKNKRAEILLLDEVFGSGADLRFENKAILKMEELIKGGITVVMVSHSLDVIGKYCDKVIWLDKGKIREIGAPKEIIANYTK